MNKLNISGDVILTVVSLIIGVVLGVVVSDHYYGKGLIDNRESLINAAISDIEGWQSEDAYPGLHDSAKYAASGKPWPKLSARGIEELSRNIHDFKHFKHYETLRIRVSECVREVEYLNDRLFLRNLSIVSSPNLPGLPAEMSPRAYHYFQSDVLPAADSLLGLLKQNKVWLLGD